MAEPHAQEKFEQHPVAWAWRARCLCGWHGDWRASPDRAQRDYTAHAGTAGITEARDG